jgi:hypothetical protein
MADGLADLGTPIDDRILVLNILEGLNQRFEHVSSIIRRYLPFLNFLKVRDDLLLEELHMDSTGPPAAPTVLYTNIASLTTKPPSSTSSHPPHGGTGGNRSKYHNKNHNSGNGGDHNDWFRRLDHRTMADLRPPVAGAHYYVPQPRARWTAAFVGLRGHTGPLRVSRPPVWATATTTGAAIPARCPGTRMQPLARCQLGPAVAGQLFQLHDAPSPPTSV